MDTQALDSREPKVNLLSAFTSPAFTSHFKVSIPATPAFASQVKDVSVDLVKRKIRLNVTENIDGTITKAIRHLLNRRFAVDLYFYARAEPNELPATTFENCAISEHNVFFTYEKSEIVNHWVTISY